MTKLTKKGVFLTLLICFVFIACPPSTKKPPIKKIPRQGEVVHERQKEVTAATPQRKASLLLVDKGVLELNVKNYDQALQIFQDAVNVDASNGVAYYYLALTDQELGQSDVASGLLDKAETLLRDDGYWMEKIQELRAAITGEKRDEY